MIQCDKCSCEKNMSHSIQVNYIAWGLGSPPNIISTHIDDRAVKKNIDAIGKTFPLKKLHFLSAISVNYFQGSDTPDKELLLFRFNTSTTKTSEFGGAHVSILIDSVDHKIFGLMDLRITTSKKVYTTHDIALATAVSFLKNAASDLVSSTTSLPDMSSHNAKPGEKITFSDHPKIGLLELHWIGQHSEFIKNKNELTEIVGMKVKFYHRERNLWLWVIVNQNNKVICYERDVFWNFDEVRRDTQMWLHDQWLMAHGLI